MNRVVCKDPSIVVPVAVETNRPHLTYGDIAEAAKTSLPARTRRSR